MDDIVTDLSPSNTFLDELFEISRVSALEEMASGVAHELNQPLAAIATFSHAGEHMLNRPDPLVSRALDVFKQISLEALSAGDRLLGIRRLFAQARTQLTRCQMPDLVADVRPVLNNLALRFNASLKVKVPAALPDVRIDRLRIGYVLLALAKNALEASTQAAGERAIEIDICAERYTIETGITDFGAGVAPEVEEQLFRPFFTSKPRGTGLGLASSRAIVESHEGTIGFHNLPAGGVRFWFRLPIAHD
jgi:C4-dicarboxylate-specific signal transduction histidine kinase